MPERASTKKVCAFYGTAERPGGLQVDRNQNEFSVVPMSVRYPGGLVGQGSRRELGRVLEGSWKDLGRLLEGSWKGLGRVLEELPTKSMLRMQPLLKRDYKP